MANTVFIDYSIALDRIPVNQAQLVAFPNVLCYGRCQVLSDLTVIIPTEEEIKIESAEFCKFGFALVYFNNLSVEEPINKTIEFQNCTLTIEVSDKAKCLVLNASNVSYKFYKDALLLSSAFYDLALIPYCYSPRLTNDLYKVIKSLSSEAVTTLDEEHLINSFPSLINIQTDYYILSKLVFRHRQLIQILKDVEKCEA